MWFLNFLFTLNRVFNTKDSFPSCMFVVMDSGKCELHTFYIFYKEFQTPHILKNLIFFCIIYVRMSNIHFSVPILSKRLAKHINTKVSFKITIRTRHVYTDIRWPWKWNQYFYLGIWEDERSKIILLPAYQLVTRLNSQNRNETSLLMISVTLICIWILAFPICIVHVSTPRKWIFLLYFSSLHDYWLQPL